MVLSVSAGLRGGQSSLLPYWQADCFVFVFTSYSLNYALIGYSKFLEKD